jgi:putative membrane protein
MPDADGEPEHTPPAGRGPDWSARTLLGVYARGLAMGSADAVPGVSGGTIALITGIYERLIGALTAVSPRRGVAVLEGVRPASDARRRAYDALQEMDAAFLVALAFGVFSAIVAVTAAVEVAITEHPVPTFGFFFGLIAASAVVLAADVSLSSPEQIGAGAAGFLVAFFVSGQAANGLGHELPIVFLAGVIAVSAMILPGISGSLLLLLLGQYTYMTGTLSTLRRRVVDLATGGEVSALVQPATVTIVFVAGAVVGLFTVAHAVRWALDHHRAATRAFLVSLIVGALRAPVIQIGRALSEAGRSWSGDVLAVVAGTALVGALLVVAVERVAGGVDY